MSLLKKTFLLLAAPDIEYIDSRRSRLINPTPVPLAKRVCLPSVVVGVEMSCSLAVLLILQSKKSKKLAKRNRLKKGGKDGLKRGCALECTS